MYLGVNRVFVSHNIAWSRQVGTLFHIGHDSKINIRITPIVTQLIWLPAPFTPTATKHEIHRLCCLDAVLEVYIVIAQSRI